MRVQVLGNCWGRTPPTRKSFLLRGDLLAGGSLDSTLLKKEQQLSTAAEEHVLMPQRPKGLRPIISMGQLRPPSSPGGPIFKGVFLSTLLGSC